MRQPPSRRVRLPRMGRGRGRPAERWGAHPKLVLHSVAKFLLTHSRGHTASQKIASSAFSGSRLANSGRTTIITEAETLNNVHARSTFLRCHLLRKRVKLAGQGPNCAGHFFINLKAVQFVLIKLT